MSVAECPHCFKCFEYDGDCEGFNQDSAQVFNCSECGKEFEADVYWDLVITNERKRKVKDE